MKKYHSCLIYLVHAALPAFLFLITTTCYGETLNYKVLKEEVYDKPIKTQVKLEVEVYGDITESNVRELLENLYQGISKRTGFQYHKNPTNIFIYAFIKSKTHTSYWCVGQLKYVYGYPPKITIFEVYIPSSLVVPTDERYGLSGQKRIEIWNEIWTRVNALMTDAEKKFPATASGLNWWKTATATEKERFRKFTQDGEKKNEEQVKKKYGLTDEQYHGILREGFERNWPYPL